MDVGSYRDIRNVVLVLGYKCNFKCRYCCEYETSDCISSELNPKVIEFLLSLSRQAKSCGKTFGVSFFGGEPLLYTDHIRAVIEALKGEGNVGYSISSNGSLLTPELVKYFNENNVTFGLSWDGRNTDFTRRRDVLKEDRIRNLFFDLNHKEVMCVFSSQTYIRNFLEDLHNLRYLYWKRTGKETIKFRYELIMDHSIPDPSLLEVDLNRVRKDMEYICNEYSKYKWEHAPLSNTIIDFVDARIAQAQFEVNRENFLYTKPKCFQMSEEMALDVAGNFHYCHIQDNIIGTLDNSFPEVQKNYGGYSVITDRCRTRCHKCPVVIFCKGGCPALQGSQLEAFCAFNNAMYMPLVELVHTINERDKA
jgi:radical SAM protein with 4Fe4S-binding SPASM domain